MMIRKFISLEWKQLMRSPNLAQSAGVAVLLGFLAFIYGLWFIVWSTQLYGILQAKFPDQNPFVSANRFVVYWLFFDLTVRYFFQKLPNLNIPSLLTLNIRKPKIIHYILGRSFFSFLNLIAAFASIPFALVLLSNGYESVQILTWLAFLLLATMSVNCLHIIVTSKEGTGKEYFGFGIVLFFTIAICLDYFGVFSLGTIFGKAIDALVAQSYFLVVPALVLVGIYAYAYKTLKQHFYLDAVLQVKHKNRKTSQLTWVERFGGLAPLLKKDLRMIWRSKRTRGILVSCVFLLFYGLIFYTDDNEMSKAMAIFVGIFVTGLFIYNFGMYIPSWDGAYFRLLQCQNIDEKDYLKSKYLLLVCSGIIAFMLTIPYVYFGWEILLIHFAGFMYNIGVGVMLVLLYGSTRRKAMDLDSRATFNYQGLAGMDFFIVLPLLLAPLIVFAIVKWLGGLYVAVGLFVLLGLCGLLFRERILDKIARRYKKNKYKMLIGFSQK